jgi:FkbM family methyltransferase
MKVVASPADFPASVTYGFARDGEISRHLGRVLALVCPTSVCTGYGAVDELDDKIFVVLCEANWIDQRESWIAEHGNDDQLIVFPVMEGDPWSWWEFSKLAVDRLLYDDGAVLSQNKFADFLVQDIKRAEYDENGALRLNHFSYLAFHHDRIAPHANEWKQVIDGLSDDASKQVLQVLLSDPQNVWNHFLSHTFSSVQYFDYIDYSKCRSVLNGGIWLGFEMPLLFALLPDDAVVHNVDPFGHDHISDYAAPTIEHFQDRCVVHRLALSDFTGETSLKVMPDGQANLTNAEHDVEEGSEDTFPCTTVDQLVQDQGLEHLDLIKFDLEGGETAALKGMVETVRRFRPQLAISIYHFLNDYWSIPLFLMEICEDYDFHVGHYSYERFETVFYCIPREVSAARKTKAVKTQVEAFRTNPVSH